MAASVPSLISTPGLSQKQRKAILKRERRKRKRQALAKQGFKDGENHNSLDEEEANEDEEERQAEEERQQLHAEWLRREMLAQEEFRLRFEKEEAARMRKEEDERRIKEEWEAQQRREEEEKEQKQQQRRDRELFLNYDKFSIKESILPAPAVTLEDEAVQKMLDQAESQLENGGPWMNPEAPDTQNFGTERDRANCPFFLKTGSCRFGDRYSKEGPVAIVLGLIKCSRRHVYPESSPTLLIRGMFVTFGMDQSRRDDYDTDAGLEDSEEELHQRFLDFYQDVLPEFSSLGKVVQFKVSCNYEPHLRGNVYVQFDTEDECREALVKFNGRWYAGKQLQCELCPVTRWKNAICGLFDRQRCPKGKHCNFLHVYRNPSNQFWEADRDLHLSPNRGGGTHTGGRYSERRGDRGSRRGSRSPLRSERSQGRRQPWERGSERRSRDGGSVRSRRERSRSQSKERRSGRSWGSRERENSMTSGRSSWSRASSRRDRQRSRSRERGGGDGERERDRRRSRSRERGGGDGERERDKQKSRSRERGGDGDRQRSGSRERGGGDGERDRDGQRSRERARDGERDRYRQRDGDKRRDKSGEGDGEGDRDRERRRSREGDGERGRWTEGDEWRNGEKEGDGERSGAKERRTTVTPNGGGDEGKARSTTGLNPSDKKTPDCSTTPRHHKHSKKSKKRKSKKKKKRSKASESPDRGSTSGEEEEEVEGERGSEVEMNPSASGKAEVVLEEWVESSAGGLIPERSTETNEGSPAQQSADSPDTLSKNAADCAKEEPVPVQSPSE